MAESEQQNTAGDSATGGAGQPEPPGRTEELTQAQIDDMVAATGVSSPLPGAGRVFSHRGEAFPQAEPPRVEAYDFANPAVIEEFLMRTLRQRHGDFAALLSARLSILLRIDVALKLQRVSTQVYRRFAASIANPSHVVLFKLEPLAGVGVLDIAPPFGLALVDRLLGGEGVSDSGASALTEIEMNLLDDLNLVLLDEWTRIWGGEGRMEPKVLGRESGGRYLQTSASDTVMLVAVFEGVIGDCVERLQLAMPFPSVEPMVRRLATLLPAARKEGVETSSASWRSTYNRIPIPLSIEWDAREISVAEVLELAPGSVIRLPREIIRETRVRLADVSKFVGEIGVEQGRLAIRIDQTLSPEEA